MEIRTRSLTRSSPEGAMEDGKILPLNWNNASLPKTELPQSPAASVHYLLVAVTLLPFSQPSPHKRHCALSSQEALCSVAKHSVGVLLLFLFSSVASLVIWSCWRINEVSVSNQPGPH